MRMYDGTSDPDNHMVIYNQRILTIAIKKEFKEATYYVQKFRFNPNQTLSICQMDRDAPLQSWLTSLWNISQVAETRQDR